MVDAMFALFVLMLSSGCESHSCYQSSGASSHERGRDSCYDVSRHLCRHRRHDFGLLLRSDGVEELVPRQGLAVVLHQHPQSALVMTGDVLYASNERTREVLDARDPQTIRSESQLSEFCI